MFKILSNLRKSIGSVIVIIVLLCAQAWIDLELPNYTSKIVNIGIQQGGIENPTPKVITKLQMDNLLLFTKQDEEILKDYKLISKENLDQKQYDEYLKQYPAIENEKLYILNEIEEEEQENLNSIMSKPLMILSNISNTETADSIKNEIINNMTNYDFTSDSSFGFDLNIEQVNQMKLIDIVKMLPEETLEKVVESFEMQMNQMSESILEQAAISSVKEQYKIVGIDTDKLQNDYIFISGLQMLAIAFMSMIAAVIIILLSSKVGAKLGKDLRDKVFNKVINFSTKEFREFSTASLITRSTNDIQQIQGLIGILFRVVVYAPIMGFGGLIRVITGSNTSMAWIIGLAIAIIVIVILTLFIIAMPKFKKAQELIDKLNLVSREILTGIPVIRAFNTEEREEKRFNLANFDLMKNNIFINRAMSIMMPALMFIMNAITILIIWVGAKNVDLGQMQVGDIMAFIQYTIQIVTSFLMISMISIMLPRAAVSAKRINEVLETNPNIKDKKETKQFDEAKKGLVEFKNVSFKYPDADTEMLTDIDFVAKPGETTAIIGSTGSGKSSIVNLIPRFYDVTGGELLINGINVKDVQLKELRKRVGFVPQKGVLFSGTIESNIKYGNPEMTDKEMIKAAKIAQAEEFILSKEDKYKSTIAQGGNNVSGGQKQRLSIARALAIDPEILVFDDSFSALDLKTDSKLRETLAKETKGKTIIIVAQRISTIMNAEQIIVLEEGKIVGKGTHEQLMENCETYKQIALSQLSEEELKNGGDK